MARGRASNRGGSSSKRALEELVEARRGGRGGRRSAEHERSSSGRLQSKLIESSASEASVRSQSSGGESSDEDGLRKVASRLKATGWSRKKRRTRVKEVRKFVKFGEGRACHEREELDSASDLDDFLVPDDDDEYSDESSSKGEAKEVGRGRWRKKGAREVASSPRKKVQRVVDSDSSSSGGNPGDGGEMERGRRTSEPSSESEEWDEGLAGGISNQGEGERALRERKSIRELHGGLSPLQRIRSAQQRALGVGVDDGADMDGGEDGADMDGGEDGAEMDGGEDGAEMDGGEVLAGVKPGRKERKERKKGKKKGEKEEKNMHLREPELEAGPVQEPNPLHLSPSGTTSTVTRSASAGSASTLTRSDSSSTTSSSTAPDQSSSSSEYDSFVSEASIGSAERRQVQDLLMTEVGSLGAMSEEEAFRAYMELLFCSSIDPAYEKQVQASASHREHYAAAKAKIEYLIITAQQYAHSQAWVNCDPYLLEAVEQYSRFEIRKRVWRSMHKANKPVTDDEDVNCAACNKWSGHRKDAMCHLHFVGRRHKNAIVCPGESKLGEGLRLSHDYLLASPVYQQNRGLWGKGNLPECEEELIGAGDPGKKQRKKEPPRKFYLGYVCCRRVTTFHALLHFRRHCLIYLTRRAKDVSDRLGKMSMNTLLDHVLHEDAHKLMYKCFQSMLEVARTMQLSTGQEALYAVSRHGAFRTRAPQELLLGNEGTDVSSLDWSEDHRPDGDHGGDEASS